MRAHSLVVPSRARDHLLATQHGLAVVPFTLEQSGGPASTVQGGRQAGRQEGALPVPPCVCAAYTRALDKLEKGGWGPAGWYSTVHGDADSVAWCAVVCCVISLCLPT